MSRLFSKKVSRWLLPVALVLFILQVLTLPFVLGYTYSGRSEAPDHVLTYTEGKLTWDSATNISEDGVAQLRVYEAQYPGVISADGENVVAPGTEAFHIVRLKNDVEGSIQYTAVLYQIIEDEDLPVDTSLAGTDLSDTQTYSLPAGVSETDVIRAVSGNLPGGMIQDFDIRWLWEYEESEAQDLVDTGFGNEEDAEQITVGLYIVVEDGNSYVIPELPQTGDHSFVILYVVLMVLSAVLLILLFCDRRKARKCQ